MFDQTIFHMTISLSFFKQATTEVANSGKLVHTATIVKPIIVCETPKCEAIFILESTITFAQRDNQIIHHTIKTIDFHIGNFSKCSSCSSSKFSMIQNV
jgi:hypothetical protein